MRSTTLLIMVLLTACSSKGGGPDADATGAAGSSDAGDATGAAGSSDAADATGAAGSSDAADASGAAGTTDATGTAGTTGAGGTAPAPWCPSLACCDKPESGSGCAATLAQQLASNCRASGATEHTQTACGAYQKVVSDCLFFTVQCFYGAQGQQLEAWRKCEDTVGPCGDNCTYGGRHADGGLTEFFRPDAGATCP